MIERHSKMSDSGSFGQWPDHSHNDEGPGVYTEDANLKAISNFKAFRTMFAYKWLIKLNRTLPTLLEIIIPIVVAASLLFMQQAELQTQPAEIYAQSPINSTNSSRVGSGKDYSRCFFAQYSGLTLAYSTDHMATDIKKAVESFLRDTRAYAITDFNTLHEVLCSPTLSSDSPLLRPWFHHQRTYDGKFLTYLPVMLHTLGNLVFRSYYEEIGDEDLQASPSCQSLKGFFDNYLFNMNPYVYQAQLSLHPSETTDFMERSYFRELRELENILTRSPGSVSHPLVSKYLSPDNSLVWFEHACRMLAGVKPSPKTYRLREHLTPHISEYSLYDSKPVSADSSSGLDETVAEVACHEKKLFTITPTEFIPAKISIRIKVGSFATVSTRDELINLDGAVIPHDGSHAQRYFRGNLIPGDQAVGGFLQIQNLIYAHYFNITNVRAVSYTASGPQGPLGEQNAEPPLSDNASPSRKRVLVETSELSGKGARPSVANIQSAGETGFSAPEMANIFDSSSHLKAPRNCVSPFDKSSASEFGNLPYPEKSEISMDHLRDIPATKSRAKERRRRLQGKTCHTECIDYTLTNQRVCNPVCNKLYSALPKSEFPIISFQESRQMTPVLLACTRLPYGWSAYDNCTMFAKQAACHSCSKTVDELFTFLAETVDGFDMTSPDFSAALKAFLSKLSPENSSKFSDQLFCLGYLAWLSSLDGGVNYLKDAATLGGILELQRVSRAFKAKNRPIFNRPILDGLIANIEEGNCSLTGTVYYFGNAFTRSYKGTTPDQPQLNYGEIYWAMQVLVNVWMTIKTRPLTEALTPLRFTESFTPVVASKFNPSAHYWMKTGFWGFIWSVFYVIISYNMVREFVVDYRPEIRETLQIYNVKQSILYSSVFLVYAIYLIAVCSIICGLTTFHHPSWPYFFIFILHACFAVSIISFSFLTSSLASNMSSIAAANLSAVIYLISGILQFISSLQLENGAMNVLNTLTKFISPRVFAQGNALMMATEVSTIPTDWASKGFFDYFQISFRNTSYLEILQSLVVNSAIYLILGFYLLQLHPGAYGIPKPIYYPLTINYWFPRFSFSEIYERLRNLSMQMRPCSDPHWGVYRNYTLPSASSMAGELEDLHDLERISRFWAILPDETVVRDRKSPIIYDAQQEPPIISVQALQKNYVQHPYGIPCMKTSTSAVSQVSFEVYRGELFCLLGHNGAGKTTILSMLTGMTPPTSGSIKISGYDIVKNTKLARQRIGFCPQHSFFFSELTVRQHLMLFAKINNVAPSHVQQKILDTAEKVHLTEKLDCKAGALSGGQQRSLSVALALLSGVDVFLFDEPSSGMDPHTRRYLWRAIKQLGKDKAIILTTHFLEEADYLSDTISILSSSRLRCFGTPYFLKSIYGVGYTCTFVKAPNFSKTHQQLLLSVFHQSEVVTNAALEISLRIPWESSESIVGALQLVEAIPSKFAIEKFSIKLTTLDEVFFNVEAKTLHEHNSASQTRSQDKFQSRRITGVNTAREIGPDPGRHAKKKSIGSLGSKDVFQRISQLNASLKHNPSGLTKISALLQKRAWKVKRTLSAVIVQMFIPVFLLILSLGLSDQLFGNVYPPVSMNGDALAAYKYARLSPSKVLLGSESSNLNTTLISSEQTADIMQKCLGGHFAHFSASRASNDTTLETFQTKMLDSWKEQPTQDPSGKVDADYSGFNLVGFYFDESHNAMGDYEMVARDEKVPKQWKPIVSELFKFQTIHKPLSSGWLFHNTTFRDALPTGFHLYASCLLQSRLGLERPIEILNHPFDSSQEAQLSVFFFSISLATIGVVGCANVMEERLSGSKLAQHDAGISVFQYWLAAFIFDCIFYLIPASLIFLAAKLINVKALMEGTTQWVFLGLLLIYGIALMPYSYLVTRKSKNPLTTQATLAMSGVLLPIIAQSMKYMSSTAAIYSSFLKYILLVFPPIALFEGMNSIAIYNFRIGSWTGVLKMDSLGLSLVYLFGSAILAFLLVVKVEKAIIERRVHPAGAMGKLFGRRRSNQTPVQTIRKFNHAARKGTGNLRLQNCIPHQPEGPTHAVQSSNDDMTRDYSRAKMKRSCFSVRRSHSSDCVMSCSLIHQDDDDVIDEKQRVLQHRHRRETGALEDWDLSVPRSENYLLTIEGLTKVHHGSCLCPNTNVAVDDLWLAVPKGQCLGLLGSNGAGKTTTIQMITGRVKPTLGTATVCGQDIFETNKVNEHIGYCPQKDFCFPNLTGREHLSFYLKWRVPKNQLNSIVQDVIDRVGIRESADRVVSKYSGGDRRKLALALTFIGDPEVVILDEPSSGVDPTSRRQLWNIIQGTARASERAVVITSHSMEECEALCDRVCILQNGKLICIGTPAHIRSKFGQGYQFEVVINPNKLTPMGASDPHAESDQSLEASLRFEEEYMRRIFPGAFLVEKLGYHQRWSIPKELTSLDKIFSQANLLRKLGVIKSYGVNEVTLEDIFIKLSEPKMTSNQGKNGKKRDLD